MIEKPESNSLWQHNNGNVYKVLLLANEHSEKEDYPVTVVYQGDNGLVWSRPLSRWYDSMTRIVIEGQQ